METVPDAEREGMGELDDDGLEEEDFDSSGDDDDEGDGPAVRVWLTPPVTAADSLAAALKLLVGDVEGVVDTVTVLDGSGELVVVVEADTLLVFVTIPEEVPDVLATGLFDTHALTLALDEIRLEDVKEAIDEELTLTDGDPVLEGMLDEVLDTLGERVWVGEVVLDLVPSGVFVAAFELVGV